MISDIEILIENYAVALLNNNVSTDIREEIFEAVGRNYKLIMKVVDVIILFAKNMMTDAAWNYEKSMELVKSEYMAIGFGTVMQYKFIAPAIKIYLDKTAFVSLPDDKKAAEVKEIYIGNSTNPHETLKLAMYMYCAKLIIKFNLYFVDAELTKTLTEEVNEYSQEERENAILPLSVMNNI